jgi:hypothetical protein
MTQSEGRAPHKNPADTTQPEVDTAERNSGDHQPGRGEELLAQLRRRREAALRLPPLASGRRDPAERDDICGWWR